MVKKNNLIYDVGLHKGKDTLFYLKEGFQVVAFEANPSLIEYCKQYFANEIESGQLIIVEGAIIDFNTSIKEDSVIFFKNANDAWGTVNKTWAERNQYLGYQNEIIKVNTVNFKDCLEKYGIPYFLKIDIEGMDTICLKALLNFEERPDYISIESDKRSFKGLKEEFELFKKLGYSSFKIINQAKVRHQKEPKQTKEGKFCNHSFSVGSSGLFGSDLP